MAFAIPVIAAAGKSAATAAVTGAAISGAAGLGASALQSRSAGRAGKAQEKANADALAYEREREAARKVRYDQTMAQRQQAFDAWYKRVGDEGIKRYGVPTGLTIPGTIGGGGGQKATKVGGAVPLGGAPEAPRTLGDLMGGAPAPMAAPASPDGTQPRTLADLMQREGSWGDWRRYGVGG